MQKWLSYANMIACKLNYSVCCTNSTQVFSLYFFYSWVTHVISDHLQTQPLMSSCHNSSSLSEWIYQNQTTHFHKQTLVVILN